MTSTAIPHRTQSSRLRSIQADLAFWSVAGAIVAALSAQLAASWGVPRGVLLDVGLAFAVLGPAMLLGLNRMRITRGLVGAFVVTNLVLAPLAWVAAACGWLPLTGAGTWALADAGVVMLVLGLWQFAAMRSSHS
jgi:hypothetical protein